MLFCVLYCLTQAGKTPLQLAEDKNYSEIANLLKTGVPAQPEGESARAEEEGIMTLI